MTVELEVVERVGVILGAMKTLATRAHLVRTSDTFEGDMVPSPCVSVCKMDEARLYCQGCLRTLDELRAWGNLDNSAKRAVWQLVEARMP
jgi:predicted Fe-S protein YdhL (DUF1289 family)